MEVLSERKSRLANFIGRSLKSVGAGYLGRERFLLISQLYRFFPLLGLDNGRGIEQQFVLSNLPSTKNLKLLDVGSSSSLLVYELNGRGFDTYAIDARGYFEALPSSIHFFLGDITRTCFPDAFFDVVILLSTIEHIGIGYYGDPKMDDGDFRAMEEIKRITRPNATVYVTTNICKEYAFDGCQRRYDAERLDKLVSGFVVEKQEFFLFQRDRYVKVSRGVASAQTLPTNTIVCLKLQKR